jgi:superfamily II DNA or RNA helicase
MEEPQKVILSNRLYFKPENNTQLKYIIDQLTYKIETKTGQKGKFKNIEIIRNYKSLPKGIISIPQGRLDLVPDGLQLIDKRVLNPVPFPNPKFELREGQQVVYDEVHDSCFINALVGWGKTFTALHIARKLGQKTLVVTHTAMLRDQWIDEVRALFNMEPGVIGSGNFDIEDKAIVIGNVQTVTKMLPQLAKEFGTIILDEAHHVPASTFSSIIDSSYARYRIALSGTMLRTDGKHIIFQDYFGNNIIKPPQSHTLNPTVKIIKTGISIAAGLGWAQKVNSLLYDEEYQEFVANLAKVQIGLGHSVLVVADRVEFLNNVKDLVGESCILITGETDYTTRKQLISEVESGKKMCVAGSRQIFSEGISINRLSCVILAVPTSNPISLEQIIGRIMRLHPDKLNPVVLDLNFSSAAEKRQDTARLGFYASKGWQVQKL